MKDLEAREQIGEARIIGTDGVAGTGLAFSMRSHAINVSLVAPGSPVPISVSASYWRGR